MIYGTCVRCEFEISGQSIDELDLKFKRHFVISGHDAYFYNEKNDQKSMTKINLTTNESVNHKNNGKNGHKNNEKDD